MDAVKIILNNVFGEPIKWNVAGIAISFDTIHPDLQSINLDISDTEEEKTLLKIYVKKIADSLSVKGADGQIRLRFFRGYPDFLPVNFLLLGTAAAQPVCRLLRRYSEPSVENLLEQINQSVEDNETSSLLTTVFRLWNISLKPDRPSLQANLAEIKAKILEDPIPYATGFLVGGSYLLTNYHLFKDEIEKKVLQPKDLLPEFIAEFGYEKDYRGQLKPTQKFRFDPEFFYPCQKRDLDYVLLKLKDFNSVDLGIGYLPLPNKDKVLITAAPCRKNQIKTLNLDFGQSDPNSLTVEQFLAQIPDQAQEPEFPGSPVNVIQHSQGDPKEVVIFDNRVQKIYQDFLIYDTDTEPGSSGSPLLDNDWNLIGLHRGAVVTEKDEKSFTISGFLGIRASSIVQDLRGQAEKSPPVQDFLRQWVDLTSKNIFLVAGRDRTNRIGANQAETERKLMMNLWQKVAEHLRQAGFELPEISLKDLEQVVNQINQKSGRGDIALELLMDTPKKTEFPGSLVLYYNGADLCNEQQAINFANQLINSTLNTRSEVRSDRRTSTGSLAFCRKVMVPSMVLYVGSVNNSASCDWVSQNMEALAANIALGLVAWRKSFDA